MHKLCAVLYRIEPFDRSFGRLCVTNAVIGLARIRGNNEPERLSVKGSTVTREVRTAAISAATIVVLVTVGIAVAVQCSKAEPEEPATNAAIHSAPSSSPEQLEAKKREEESRQWADELHEVLVSTPEYQKQFEVEVPTLDDAMRPVDTALEEIERRTR
jgi:hypothetical protein